MNGSDDLEVYKNVPRSVNGFIWMLIKRYKISFILSCIGCLAVAIEHTAFPYVTKLLVDGLGTYQSGSIFKHLQFPLTLGAVIWVGNDGLWRLAGYTISYLRASSEAFIKEYLTMHFISQNPAFFDKYQSGDLMGRTLHTSQELPFIMEEALYFIIPCILNFIAILALVAHVDLKISMWIFIWVALHVSICAYFTKKHIKYSKKYALSMNRFNAVIQDSTQNHVSVKSFGGFKTERGIFKIFSSMQKRRQTNMLYIYQYMLVILSLNCFIINGVIVTMIELDLFTQKAITIGDIAMIFQLSSNFIVLMFETTLLFGEVIQTYGVVNQNYKVMLDIKHPEYAKYPTSLQVTSGIIALQNLSFSYSDIPGEYLFNGINLAILPHQKVGIIGRSGSGKSTLIGLIMKNFDNYTGEILIDGQSIKNIPQDEIMKCISYIPQHPTLFNRTIMENIRYGKPNASDAEVIEAAKIAGIHEEIMEMPGHYHMLAGELGSELSGGQRQRVAVARAVLKNSPILILDEATSGLDVNTERTLRDALQIVMQEKTVIVVAHKLSTVSVLDRIIVIEDGVILEDGSPEELMEKEDGVYRSMIDIQVEDLAEE